MLTHSQLDGGSLCRKCWCHPPSGVSGSVYARWSSRCQKRRVPSQDSDLSRRVTNKEPADYVSAFPAGVNVAATWDRGLARLRGEAMGAEHRDKGVDVQLGPVCGPLGRAPEGGRNWVSTTVQDTTVVRLTCNRKGSVPTHI